MKILQGLSQILRLWCCIKAVSSRANLVLAHAQEIQTLRIEILYSFLITLFYCFLLSYHPTARTDPLKRSYHPSARTDPLKRSYHPSARTDLLKRSYHPSARTDPLKRSYHPLARTDLLKRSYHPSELKN